MDAYETAAQGDTDRVAHRRVDHPRVGHRRVVRRVAVAAVLDRQPTPRGAVALHRGDGEQDRRRQRGLVAERRGVRPPGRPVEEPSPLDGEVPSPGPVLDAPAEPYVGQQVPRALGEYGGAPAAMG
ncbi:hypothetical protein [Streptomyces vietnamensis]|uniref:hypothetical protein n=1 Tax=Streptomyces vietnamensis TaxID=362257 RepID=UPI00342A79EF